MLLINLIGIFLCVCVLLIARIVALTLERNDLRRELARKDRTLKAG